MTAVPPIRHRSPFPDVAVPEHLSIPEFVLNSPALTSHPNRPILADLQGCTLTPVQLRHAVRAVAAGLHEEGVRKGDVVCLFLPNVIEFPVAFYAITLLGAVCTTCNPQYTADELANQLKDSDATSVIAFSPLLNKVQAAIRAAGGRAAIKRLYVVGTSTCDEAKPFDHLLACPHAPPRVSINPKIDIAALPYSSGTTGVSKGVVLTHYNLIANVCQHSGMEPDLGSEDVSLVTLPLFHIYGMVLIMHGGLYRGMKLVLMPSFDLVTYLRLAQEHKVTVVHIVPPLAILLIKHPLVSQHELSSLRFIFCGAAPLSADAEEQLRYRLPNVKVRQGYGMTEMSPLTHAGIISDDSTPPGSCGRLVPNCEAKLIDLETGEPLKSYDDKGELWLRGPNRMIGYYKRPQATRETIDAEGFLHTGDIAKLDHNGYFFVIDRVKELIKYKGFQVPPAELEAKLLEHPAVADVAVIGIPDAYAGELPKAFIVKKEGEDRLGAEEISEWLNAKVSPSKRLRGGVQFVEAIPKTPSGKILRRLVRELHKEESTLSAHRPTVGAKL